MTRVKLLNNVDHAGLRIRMGGGAGFGDDLNQAPVLPAEFEEAQREYPIVFREDDGVYRAVVLLGFDARENLFLGERGWDARYVPAMHRRGPLSIAQGSAGEGGGPVIHIDLDHPRVSETEGEPLFLLHGGNAPILETMAEGLRIIFEGASTQRAFSTVLDGAKLLQPVTLDVEIGDGRRFEIANVFVVSREALAELDAATLYRLNQAGFLAPAMFAAASLANVARLADKKRAKDAA